MKSDCLVKRFLQTKGRRTNSLRFVTPSNQHHCFTFQNTIVFDSPIQMPTHPMIHSFIACRILENGVGMIHWDSLSFRWSVEMGCVCTFWILQHLDNSVVDSIDSMMISFLWSEWGVEWVCQTLWHCGSEGTVCCWMNATPWKQNGFSIQSVCCLLDCDLLWCWINRWIRLWKEMICWFCFILLISSDNLSVGEESCESAIPWILDLISFVVISIILSTGNMEWPSWLLLFLPSHQKAIPIQSIFSNPSIQLIHRVETTSIESTYLETGFLSIHHAVIHLDS